MAARLRIPAKLPALKMAWDEEEEEDGWHSDHDDRGADPVLVVLPDSSVRIYHEPFLRAGAVLADFPAHRLVGCTPASAARDCATATGELPPNRLLRRGSTYQLVSCAEEEDEEERGLPPRREAPVWTRSLGVEAAAVPAGWVDGREVREAKRMTVRGAGGARCASCTEGRRAAEAHYSGYHCAADFRSSAHHHSSGATADAAAAAAAAAATQGTCCGITTLGRPLSRTASVPSSLTLPSHTEEFLKPNAIKSQTPPAASAQQQISFWRGEASVHHHDQYHHSHQPRPQRQIFYEAPQLACPWTAGHYCPPPPPPPTAAAAAAAAATCLPIPTDAGWASSRHLAPRPDSGGMAMPATTTTATARTAARVPEVWALPLDACVLGDAWESRQDAPGWEASLPSPRPRPHAAFLSSDGCCWAASTPTTPLPRVASPSAPAAALSDPRASREGTLGTASPGRGWLASSSPAPLPSHKAARDAAASRSTSTKGRVGGGRGSGTHGANAGCSLHRSNTLPVASLERVNAVLPPCLVPSPRQPNPSPRPSLTSPRPPVHLARPSLRSPRAFLSSSRPAHTSGPAASGGSTGWQAWAGLASTIQAKGGTSSSSSSSSSSSRSNGFSSSSGGSARRISRGKSSTTISSSSSSGSRSSAASGSGGGDAGAGRILRRESLHRCVTVAGFELESVDLTPDVLKQFTQEIGGPSDSVAGRGLADIRAAGTELENKAELFCQLHTLDVADECGVVSEGLCDVPAEGAPTAPAAATVGGAAMAFSNTLGRLWRCRSLGKLGGKMRWGEGMKVQE